MTRIKRQAERVTLYQMVIDIVQRFDEAYRAFHGRGSSLGSSLESYLIVAAVLIGERKSARSARTSFRPILAWRAPLCSGS